MQSKCSETEFLTVHAFIVLQKQIKHFSRWNEKKKNNRKKGVKLATQQHPNPQTSIKYGTTFVTTLHGPCLQNFQSQPQEQAQI